MHLINFSPREIDHQQLQVLAALVGEPHRGHAHRYQSLKRCLSRLPSLSLAWWTRRGTRREEWQHLPILILPPNSVFLRRGRHR